MRKKMKLLKVGPMILALIFVSCSKEHMETPSNIQGLDRTEDFVEAKSTIGTESKKIYTEQNGKIYETIDENGFKNVMQSIEVLSALKYPVKDWYAFKNALKNLENPMIAQTLGKSFAPDDFPLMNLKKAFDVHYNRHGSFDFARPYFPKLPSLSPDLPDFDNSAPGACEIYKREFQMYPGAAECGCRVYALALHSGNNNWQAILQGLFAARRYRATGECW